MQFIKITNEADFVNRLFLEKLGVSTKRDDENTIGQFGSGSKFAPIAALREGMRWISVGEDESGEYELEFVVKEEDGFNNIYCLYNGVELKPTSFTLEAGALSWESHYQIFREAFANALDEFIDSGAKFTVDFVDEVKFEKGKFSVYISNSPEMKEIVDKLDYYFPTEREIIWSDYGGNHKILDDGGYSDTLVYCKGALVYEGSIHGANPALFSYDIKSIVLNEERRVRYTTDVQSSIVQRFFPYLGNNDNDISIAEKILTNDGRDYFETSLDSYYFYGTPIQRMGSESAWRIAFENIYGKNVAIYEKDSLFSNDIAGAIRLHNYKPISINNNLIYLILEASGIMTASKLLGDKVKYNFIDLKKGQQEMLDSALEKIAMYTKEVEFFVNDIRVFTPIGEQDSILGVASNKNIYLSITAFRDMPTLIGTIIHEVDHIVNEYSLHDSNFRSFADDRIGNLILMLSSKNGEGNE